MGFKTVSVLVFLCITIINFKSKLAWIWFLQLLERASGPLWELYCPTWYVGMILKSLMDTGVFIYYQIFKTCPYIGYGIRKYLITGNNENETVIICAHIDVIEKGGVKIYQYYHGDDINIEMILHR